MHVLKLSSDCLFGLHNLSKLRLIFCSSKKFIDNETSTRNLSFLESDFQIL